MLDTTVVSAGGPEGAAAAALGYGVDVVTGTQWDSMTTADFAKYRALILGDRSCGSDFTAAEKNTAVWSAAVNGNVIINGTDPVFHGKVIVTNTAVAFATSAARKIGRTSVDAGGGGAAHRHLVARGLGAFNVIDVPVPPPHRRRDAPGARGSHGLASRTGLLGSRGFVAGPAIFVLAIAQDIAPSHTAADGTTERRHAGLRWCRRERHQAGARRCHGARRHAYCDATVVQNGAPFGDRTSPSP
jgi:hypothetical protein